MATKKPHPLDAVAADPKKVIALMLWKARHQEPDMYVQITERDLEAFNASNTHQKMVPDVMIKRPAGLPAQAAVPASAGRRAVPGREAGEPKPYVIVTLVEKGTENVIRSVEDNQADLDTSRDAAAVRKARDQADSLAGRILGQMRTGEFSNSDLQDAADALVLLARALRT